MDQYEIKALEDIEKYVCHVIHVIEEDDLPPFTYSVGIQKASGAPEVIVVGLKEEMGCFVVNKYNSQVRAGEKFDLNRRYSGFLGGFGQGKGDRLHFANISISYKYLRNLDRTILNMFTHL